MKKILFSVCMLSLVACTNTVEQVEGEIELQSSPIEKLEVEVIDELSDELDDNTAMNRAFYNFKEIIATGDCEKLLEITVSPVKGGCIAAILNPESPFDAEVSADMLRENCQILSDFEKELLKIQTFTESEVVQENGDCVYKAKIDIEEGKSFTWSVGCSELLNDAEFGEYLNIFKFEKAGETYKLTEIKCAG